jgi:hypothetical protein
MFARTLLAVALLLPLALLGCRRDDVPEDQFPGNDPDQVTDLTPAPMHNYADDAEEEAANAPETVNDTLQSEMQKDQEGMED